MSRRPRVLIVGGPDVNARLELMVRLKTDFEVSAVGSNPALQAEFQAQGFGYESYRLHRGVNPSSDLMSLVQLVEIFKRRRPDVVHAFDTKPGIWGCLAGRLAGVPVVIGTVTGLGSLYATNGPRTRLLRSIYEQLQRAACWASTATVFQNLADARQLVAGGIVSAGKAVVIPGSGVRTDIFDPAKVPAAERLRVRAELGVRPDEILVTMVSRVIRSKGVLDFVDAAELIRGQVATARLLLVGAEDPESLDRLSGAELARLRRAVLWPGPRRDIPAVLAASDIFVLPSAYREGVPRVLLEAAAMGLPIVTTDSPGCNDVVVGEVNGLLVREGNPDALARAIVRLACEPEVRRTFGWASRRRAVEQFDLSVVAARTADLYRGLLKGRGSRER
jgi:glycosyltransferase involved in cell wall biosynthesis